MTRLFIISLSIITSMSIFGVNTFTESSISEVQKKRDSNKTEVQLFNGENLDGWYTFIKYSQ